MLLCDRWIMTEFKIGQYVFYRSRANGRYVVMRLLPQPKGELRYTIRSQDEGRSASIQPMQANYAGCRVGDEPGA